jgi:hypothetical protein
LFEDFSQFGRWLLLSLEELGLPVEEIEINDKVVERVNASGSEGETTLLLCVCFPHQIPLEVNCRKIAVLPLMFDTYSRNADYALPFEEWPKYLGLVDDVVVPSNAVEEKLPNHIGGRTRVHVVVPKVPSLALSNFEVRDAEAQENHKISLDTEMYLSTKDGAWKNLNEPPLDVVERFSSLPFETSTLTWSLGQPENNGLWPIGFGPSEPWGLWARMTQSSFVLPVTVSGNISLIIELVGCGTNVGREIAIQFGEETKKLRLGNRFETFVLNFSPDKPVRQIVFSGYLLDRDVDQRGLGVGVATLSICRATNWSGQKSEWPALGLASDSLRPIGLHPSESWGAWAKSSTPVVLLPGFISGCVRVAIEVVGCGSNIGRCINIRMGSESHEVVLGDVAELHLLNFDLAESTNLIYIDGCDLDSEVDVRGLGVGLAFVRVTRLNDLGSDRFEWSSHHPDFEDVIATSFYPSESWGAWARSGDAHVSLPVTVQGRQIVEIELAACGVNIGKGITIRIGNSSQIVELRNPREVFSLKFSISEPTNSIHLNGYELDQTTESRALGIGVGLIRISRAHTPTEKVLQKILKNRKGILKGNPSPEKRPEIKIFQPRSKSRFELVGTAFILVIRPSDLMSESWIENIKCFVLVHKSLRGAELVVVFPSNWLTSFLPLMVELIDRLSPSTATVHFLASNFDSKEFVSLFNYSNSILILREDGLDFEFARYSVSNSRPTIGPLSKSNANTVSGESTVVVKALKQPKYVLQGMRSPLVIKTNFENQSLCQGFELAASLKMSSKDSQGSSGANNASTFQLTSIFTETHND